MRISVKDMLLYSAKCLINVHKDTFFLLVETYQMLENIHIISRTSGKTIIFFCLHTLSNTNY